MKREMLQWEQCAVINYGGIKEPEAREDLKVKRRRAASSILKQQS